VKKDRAGTLYAVATPIGNLEDITRRAERVLSEVDCVAAEDTRRTRKLLSSLGVKKPMLSHYQPKEDQAIRKIISLLQDGKDVALVTDGGTPAVSDPGYRLVKAAAEAGIRVVPVPGPSALTAALSAAGLPTDRVTFAGFPPKKKNARRRFIRELAERTDTLVFYESPGRAMDFLKDALETLGEREAVVWRELTKVYEEALRGPLSEVIETMAEKKIKGEVTVLIQGAGKRPAWSDNEILKAARHMIKQGLPPAKIASRLARASGRKRSEVYAMVEEAKNR